MTWICTIEAESTRPDGRPVEMKRTLDIWSVPTSAESNRIKAAMKYALGCRKDGGWPFLGCEIRSTDSLGVQKYYILDTNMVGDRILREIG